jgi:hypothetical protein
MYLFPLNKGGWGMYILKFVFFAKHGNILFSNFDSSAKSGFSIHNEFDCAKNGDWQRGFFAVPVPDFSQFRTFCTGINFSKVSHPPTPFVKGEF